MSVTALEIELVDPGDPVRAGGAHGTWEENGYDAAALDTYRVYAVATMPVEVLSVGDLFSAPPLLAITSSNGAFINGGLGNNGVNPPPDLTVAGPGLLFYEAQWDSYVTVAGFTVLLSPNLDNQIDGLESSFTINNGGWFLQPIGQPNTDDDDRVLILQLTVAEGVRITGDNLVISTSISGDASGPLAFDSDDAIVPVGEASLALVARSTFQPTNAVTTLPPSESGFGAGDLVFAELWASDTGADLNGLVSVYTDLLYAPGTLDVLGVVHLSPFTFLGGGNVDDDAGAVTDLGGSDATFSCGSIAPQWRRVAVVVGYVLCGGDVDLSLAPSPAEVSGCGIGAIEPDQIDFGSVLLDVVPACLYDLDSDGLVSNADLPPVAASWLAADGDGAYDASTDFDCSGLVNAADLGWFAAGWNAPCSTLGAADLPPCAICGPPLSAQAGPGADVALRLVARASPGAANVVTTLPVSIDTWEPCEEFVVELWISDVGDLNTGLIGAYFDVPIDTALLAVDGLAHTAVFALFPEGDVVAGAVVNFGGADGSFAGAGVEPEWARLGWITIETTAEGVATLTPTIGLGGLGVVGREASALDLGALAITIAESCPADVDEDASAGFGDLVNILLAWGACECCPEDVDQGGDVGFSDLTELLLAWGPCIP